MSLNKYYFLIIIFFIIESCSIFKVKNSNFEVINLTPPGCIKISDNFYCDETEIRNIDWAEYMFWTKNIFGDSSEEYLATFPDTSVWDKLDSCLNNYYIYYPFNSVYYIYPVVGISQKQAENYSKWRSDRVFEQILVDRKIIYWDTAQTKNTYFTIKRYYKGNLPSIISSEKIKFYPEYRLPTLKERKVILNYTDSIALSYFRNCHSKKCRKCLTEYPIINSDISPCDSGNITIPSDILKNSNCYIKRGNPIYNLRGNVREWSSEKYISFGGSWYDKREKILENDIFYSETVNAMTGFRNICRWKKK